MKPLTNYVVAPVRRVKGTNVYAPQRVVSPEQLEALREFAALHGRNWKQELRDAWMSGRTEGYLQQLRNQFGPSWLALFQFPEA